MNNHRLSTSRSPKLTPLARDLLLANISKLLDGPSNYEIRGDRVFIKSLNPLSLEEREREDLKVHLLQGKYSYYMQLAAI